MIVIHLIGNHCFALISLHNMVIKHEMKKVAVTCKRNIEVIKVTMVGGKKGAVEVVEMSVGNLYSYNVTFLISAAVLFVATILMIKIAYNGTGNTTIENSLETLTNRIELQDLISIEVLPLALIGGVFSFSNGIVNSFLVLVGEERGIKNIALYFTVNAICLLIVRPLAGRLSDEKEISFILYPSLILAATESLLLSNANTLTIILIAATCKAFGQGAAQPTLQNACIKKLGTSRSGVATSTFYIGADIGQGIAPIIGGTIAGKFRYSIMFYFCALLIWLRTIFKKEEPNLMVKIKILAKIIIGLNKA